MAVSVDRFDYPIPQKLLEDPEIAAWARFLHQFLYDMRERVGGDDDAVSELQGINTFETTAIMAKLSAVCAGLENLEAVVLSMQTAKIKESEDLTLIAAQLTSRISALESKLEEASDKAWL